MEKNELATITQRAGLKEPGDELSARITKTKRKVLKVKTQQGKVKYSATQYPNGTMVETKTTKP